MNNEPGGLWDFSLALYQQERVEKICLHLQDRWQVNVNIFLWARWLELRHCVLTEEKMVLAVQRLQEWDQDVVRLLRQLRYKLKEEYANDQAAQSCRQMVKAAELSAEQVELVWLEHLANNWFADGEPVKAGQNVTTYLRSLNVPADVVAATLAKMLSVDVQ
jgi:uncharacterized protein (TIGR02444 family)